MVLDRKIPRRIKLTVHIAVVKAPDEIVRFRDVMMTMMEISTVYLARLILLYLSKNSWVCFFENKIEKICKNRSQGKS
jgi:hypothetical protein